MFSNKITPLLVGKGDERVVDQTFLILHRKVISYLSIFVGAIMARINVVTFVQRKVLIGFGNCTY